MSKSELILLYKLIIKQTQDKNPLLNIQYIEYYDKEQIEREVDFLLKKNNCQTIN